MGDVPRLRSFIDRATHSAELFESVSYGDAKAAK